MSDGTALPVYPGFEVNSTYQMRVVLNATLLGTKPVGHTTVGVYADMRNGQCRFSTSQYGFYGEMVNVSFTNNLVSSSDLFMKCSKVSSETEDSYLMAYQLDDGSVNNFSHFVSNDPILAYGRSEWKQVLKFALCVVSCR